MSEQFKGRYIAIAPYYWGRGNTQEAAIQELRKAGFTGRLQGKARIFVTPFKARNPYVDDFGAIRWTWAEGSTDSEREDTGVLVKL